MNPWAIPFDVMNPGEGRTLERRLRIIRGADPATGSGIQELVGPGALWRLISVRFVLATDGTVQNRTPQLYLSDGRDRFFETVSNLSQAASLGMTYTFVSGSGLPASLATVNAGGILPNPCWLARGWRINVDVANMTAGDDISQVGMLVEEWLEV